MFLYFIVKCFYKSFTLFGFGLGFGYLQFIKKTSNPIWEEEFKFMLEQPPIDEEELNLEVISTPWKGLIYRKV